MKQHIEQFFDYLAYGYELGMKLDVSKLQAFENIIFVGMGGSAMALSVMKRLIDESKTGLPSQVVNEYTVPKRVDEKTLMICASYSGNTEETVSAMKDALLKGASMICICSGGDLKSYCQSEGHICVDLPQGIEPRAAMPVSLGAQLYVMKKLGLIEDDLVQDLKRATQWSVFHEKDVAKKMSLFAEHFLHSFPFIYTTSGYEMVALRAQQQIQENSRTLCHYHVLPEHNHNELLGWQEGSEYVSVLWLVDPDMFPRNAARSIWTKQLLRERNIEQFELHLEGPSRLTKIFTGIYQVDRLSYFLAIKRGVDPSGMEIIERLKTHLKSI